MGRLVQFTFAGVESGYILTMTRIVALIELAERAAYYGVSGPFQNYIQNAYKSPAGLPGALGLGQAAATRLTNFFAFFCYVTPVFGMFLSFLIM